MKGKNLIIDPIERLTPRSAEASSEQLTDRNFSALIRVLRQVPLLSGADYEL